MRQDLVSRAQQGDEAAFAELATGVADRLFAVAYRILRDVDTANDATQEALVTLWRELPALRDPHRFEGWAYRIVVNASYAESRKNRRRLPVALVMPVDALDDPIAAVADREQLERGFGRLPVEQRAALVLQHYLDLSLPQIAEVMGVPIGTVRSRLHYARDAMRSALEADLRPATAPSNGRLA